MRSSVVFAGLLFAVALPSAGQDSSPAIQAHTDLERVRTAPSPSLAESEACVQSHRVLLPTVREDERYIIHYLAGYCQLMAAFSDQKPESYAKAEREFSQAIFQWPSNAKTQIPPGLRILKTIAKYQRGNLKGSAADLVADLHNDIHSGSCEAASQVLTGPVASPVMDLSTCLDLVSTAKIWQAWVYGRGAQFATARRVLDSSPASIAWAQWLAAEEAIAAGKPDEFVQYALAAVTHWSIQAKNAALQLRFGPAPPIDDLYRRAGAIQMQSGEYGAAVASLDGALKLDIKDAPSFLLRAKAKEQLGLLDEALIDYLVAIETAKQQSDPGIVIGDTHFRRGVVLYKQKDYRTAQQEFTNALNSKLLEVSAADVTAWRVLASVAGGFCQSASVLEAAIRTSTDQFPKDEASSLVYGCRFEQAASLQELVSLEESAQGLTADQTQKLRRKISDLYVTRGGSAEDNHDVDAAVAAYRKAIDYNPSSGKARFNLGAIYFDQKHFAEAEKQYRALVTAQPEDFEAHYWLAESIIAQNDPSRKPEACSEFETAMKTSDQTRRAEYSKAFAAVGCRAN